MKMSKLLVALGMATMMTAVIPVGMQAAEAETEASQIEEVIAAAGWNFTVEDMQLNTELENVAVELGYTGVDTSTFSQKAEEGKQYCLMKLMIEKAGSKEVIDWSKMLLLDQDGEVYERCEDEFLKDLGMMRMAGTNLNFGKNEGWVAYEIPEDAEELTLQYEFEAETYSCKVK